MEIFVLLAGIKQIYMYVILTNEKRKRATDNEHKVDQQEFVSLLVI